MPVIPSQIPPPSSRTKTRPDYDTSAPRIPGWEAGLYRRSVVEAFIREQEDKEWQ